MPPEEKNLSDDPLVRNILTKREICKFLERRISEPAAALSGFFLQVSKKAVALTTGGGVVQRHPCNAAQELVGCVNFPCPVHLCRIQL